MIDDLRALAIFAKVIEAGSFRAAAHELKLSPSVVSHHVAQLEERLGTTLIYRSTRRLSLTHEGEQLFASAQAMLLAAENGLNSVAHQATEPSGKLNLTVPALLTRSQLLRDIAEFVKTFPKISLSISFSDVVQDVIHEGIDCAIRIGVLKDSTLKSKKLYDMQRQLVIAPATMGRYPPPQTPQDLVTWDWIGLKMRAHTRRLHHKSGKTQSIDFKPRIIADSVDAMGQLALAGLGVATPPAFLVAEDLQQGRLVEPLPDWHPESVPVYAVWPPNVSPESLAYKLIAFLDFRKKSYY